MKNLALLLTFSLFLFSCEKDYLVPKKEIPDWLKAQIEISEQRIKDDPSKMPAYGAWVRFEWKNDYYFEYSNPLSSYIGGPISMKGDTLNIFSNLIYQDYPKERCCMKYVWKGPKFNEYFSPY